MGEIELKELELKIEQTENQYIVSSVIEEKYSMPEYKELARFASDLDLLVYITLCAQAKKQLDE